MLQIPRLEAHQVGRKQTAKLANSHILYGEFINNSEPENER